MTPKLQLARVLALFAHEGQVDKAGQPYFLHVGRVALNVSHLDEKFAIVAWLHDVLEDSDKIDYNVINRLFGNEIAVAVYSLTRGRFESYDSYIWRVKINSIARQVKIADLKDNSSPDRLALLSEDDRQALSKRYEKALKELTNE